jgi:hypothetical protein
MQKGNYTVSGGTIHQIIQTDSLSVVDVYTGIFANSDKKVKIYRSDQKAQIH